MRTGMMRGRLWVLLVLLPFFWGCRDFLAGLHHHGEQTGNGVPVSIVLGEGSGPSRTIAPEHIDQAALGGYTLELTGSSDMGDSVNVQNFTLTNGQGFVSLNPGNWQLELVASRNGVEQLRGTGSMEVKDKPTSVAITLRPVAAGTGMVSVVFTIPQSVVARLDRQANGQSLVTVALYDGQGQMVQNTRMDFPVAAGAAASITYMANGAPVPSGRYTLRLSAPYTVNNAATGNVDVVYKVGHTDILYVEGGRVSSATVAIPEAGAAMGVPGIPYRQDKAGQASFTVTRSGSATGHSAANITTGRQTFSPYGAGLWVYGANWDGGTDRQNVGAGGSSGSTQGNEILLVTWSPVYDADYYELEMLLHPNYGQYDLNQEQVLNSAKYETLPVSDTDWAAYRAKSPPPLELSFSGGAGSGNHYKTKVHTHQILTTTATARTGFDFLAWRGLADGRNGGYAVASSAGAGSQGAFIGAPDTATGLSMRGTVSYRIGLEGNCNALAVLMNSFTPQHWYGIRLRAVNRFGHSDWVYWKGGKN